MALSATLRISEHVTFPSEDEKDPQSRTALVFSLVILGVSTLVLVLILTMGGQRAADFVPDDASPAVRDSVQLTELLQARLKNEIDNGITAIHFYLPQCPCQALASAHIRDLHRQRPDIGFVIAVPDSATEQQIMTVSTEFPDARVIRSPTPPPSGPALLLSRAHGDIRYFGAYGRGPGCVLPDPQYFVRLADALAAQIPPPAFFNTAVRGCFCPWPQPSAR